MLEPAKPEDEVARLHELVSLCLLDSSPEEKFDRITRLAQRHFHVEIALISLIDVNRQWFKSKQGLAACETPRNISFCGHAILSEQVFIVEDASLDPRFADNPLVTGAPFIRFYGGMPLRGPNGYLIGTLCIIDSRPRTMTRDEINTLKDLAIIIEQSLNFETLSSVTLESKRNEVKLKTILENVVDGIITFDQNYEITSINTAGNIISGYTDTDIIGQNFKILLADELQSSLTNFIRQAIENASNAITSKYREVIGKRKDGQTFNMELAISEVVIEGQKSFVAIVRDISKRMQVLNDLRVNEERWKFAIEGAGDGVWDWDILNNSVIYSKRWKEMIGYAEDEISNAVEEWSSRVHPEDMPLVMEVLQPHMDGKTPFFTNEHRFKHKDGGWIWIHDRGMVVSRDRDGKAIRVIGTHTDITERKRSDILLRDTLFKLSQAKESLQTTIDNVPALVAYWDQNLINRFANRAYQELFGPTPEQMYGRHILDIIGPVRYTLIKEKLQSVLAGNIEIFEREIPDPSGSSTHAMYAYTPHIVDGKVIGLYGFVSDTTQLKRAQSEKIAALSMVQRTIDAASEFSIIATDLEGIVTLFSAGSEKMLGYSAEEIVGKTSPAIFHSIDEVIARGERLSVEMQRPIQGFGVFVERALAGDAETLEWTYIRKDRSKIPVQLTVTAIYNDQKKISGFLGIAKDITQEKLASQTLQLAMQKAESANRSKSEFVANMSHEIRTPMNAVLGMVHLLSTTELSIEQKKYLEMIRTSGQSLLAILNDILDFSKIEAGRMELAPVHFRLADVMNAVATLMSVYAGEKDLELAIGMEANVPHHFFGDALRIQQILINLVGNAIKFTGQGEVSIFVEQVERQGNTSVLRFWVRDTGIGMSEEQQLRLFSPFTQADNSTTRRFGGTGLGLSICKQLVELMGGEIQVRSTAESGSEFCIKLPLTIDLEKADIREHRNELKNLNILVVDDNQTSRHYLRKTIEAWRWHADTVSSGQQAMDQLLTASTSEGAPPKYDVILMDWEMPDLDGLQTMQTLRTQMGKCCPPVIIMVGAFGRVKLMEQAGIADADAILQKPVTTSDLFDAMQSCLVHDSENQSGANNKTALFELRQKKSQTQLDGVTILLVEDNPLNQIVARGILEKAGARLHIVNNGKEAVDHLQTNAANYDLILMDVQMPVMDGFTATKIIRNQLQLKLPVIAMSAGVMESEKADCTKAGMDDFIGKPIDTDLLFSTILRHLQHKKNPVHAPLVNTDSPDTIDANSASPTNSNVADEQFFNPERLTGLRDINPVAYKTLLGLVKNIIDRSPAQLQQVRQDWEAARYTEAARLLHTMRGSVGILGAHQFARLSLELENAVLSPTPEDITKLLDETQSALNHTIIAASTWLAEQ